MGYFGYTELPPRDDVSPARPPDHHSPESRARWKTFADSLKEVLKARALGFGITPYPIDQMQIIVERGNADHLPCIRIEAGPESNALKRFFAELTGAINRCEHPNVMLNCYGDLFELSGQAATIDGPCTPFADVFDVLKTAYLNPRGVQLDYPATLRLEDQGTLAARRIAAHRRHPGATASETPQAKPLFHR